MLNLPVFTAPPAPVDVLAAARLYDGWTAKPAKHRRAVFTSPTYDLPSRATCTRDVAATSECGDRHCPRHRSVAYAIHQTRGSGLR